MAHKRLYDLPPANRTIIPPIGGWKASTYYRVFVTLSKTKQIGFAIFYSGFLDENGEPAHLNQLWNPSWPYTADIIEAHYLRVAGIVMRIPKRRKPNTTG